MAYEDDKSFSRGCLNGCGFYLALLIGLALAFYANARRQEAEETYHAQVWR